jgi:uncharacterized protein
MKQLSSRNHNEWAIAGASGIHGQGLFARVTIPAGTDIVEYAGPRIPYKTGKAMAESGNVYMFQANRREFIDGSVKWNLARHANHSCLPNAASVNVHGEIWLRALRAINKSEEITYDYGYTFRDDPTACRCDAPHCIGVIVANRHRSKITQR